MQFMTMREKQIVTRAIEIQKAKLAGGNYEFFRDNQATVLLKSAKIQINVWDISQIEA